MPNNLGQCEKERYERQINMIVADYTNGSQMGKPSKTKENRRAGLLQNLTTRPDVDEYARRRYGIGIPEMFTREQAIDYLLERTR